MPFVRHEPWVKFEFCSSPEHNPPSLMVLPPGIHTWECPVCGVRQTVIIPEHTLEVTSWNKEYKDQKVWSE